MPHLSTPRRKPTAALALPIMLLACAALTACGSSSSNTSTTTANAAATSTQAAGTVPATTPAGATPETTPAGASPGTAPAGAPGFAGRPGAGRFSAVRACLQKNGVTLPPRPVGGGPARRGGPGGFLGGEGPKLPKGMTRAQYEAVLEKCGGNFHGSRALGGRAVDSPRFRQALDSFAACLRQNGVDVPAPNTSGKGPIFDTKGIDTSSPQFKSAEVKCRTALFAGLRSKAGSGTTGAGSASGG